MVFIPTPIMRSDYIYRDENGKKYTYVEDYKKIEQDNKIIETLRLITRVSVATSQDSLASLHKIDELNEEANSLITLGWKIVKDNYADGILCLDLMREIKPENKGE